VAANEAAPIGGDSAARTFNQMLSSEEMQDQLEKFSLTDVMEQKFLSGEGTEHFLIDNDEMLDTIGPEKLTMTQRSISKGPKWLTRQQGRVNEE